MCWCIQNQQSKKQILYILSCIPEKNLWWVKLNYSFISHVTACLNDALLLEACKSHCVVFMYMTCHYTIAQGMKYFHL